jgi:hypothetical protein
MQGINDSLWGLTLGEIEAEKQKVNAGYYSDYREEVIKLQEERYNDPETD